VRIVYFILVFITLGSTSISSQGCILEANAPIVDNTTTEIDINISGVVLDDLTNPDQGLCGIAIEFDHDAAGDIEMFIVSPSGQEIQLMGPGGLNSELTQFVNWDISFVPCATAAAPDPFRSDVWDNQENWLINTNPTGSYYPHLGCLEDFNSGPVNGVWQLTIVDLSQIYDGNLVSIELIFCDDTGIDCSVCDPNSGILTFLDGGYCQFDPALNFQPTIPDPIPDPSDYSYSYVISQGGNIIDYIALPDLSNFSIGNYLVCGISYLNTSQVDLPLAGSPLTDLSDLIENELICAELTDQCSFVMINAEPDMITIDATICQGEMYTFQGMEFTEEDQYEVFFGSGSCDSVAEINLSVTDIDLNYGITDFTLSCNTPILNASPTVNPSLINPSYTWIQNPGNNNVGNSLNLDIGQAGIYTLTATAEGCSEMITIDVMDDGTIPDVQIVSDILTCDDQETIINITTNANSSFQWEGPGIDGLNENDEDPLVTIPGIYNVTITDNVLNCVYTDSHEVIQTVDIDPPLLIGSDITCQNSVVTITAADNDLDYTLLWSFEGNTFAEGNSVEVGSPGVYIVTATLPNGCSVITDIEISENFDLLENVDLLSSPLNCSDTISTITVTPDDPNYEYNWIGPGGVTFIGSTIAVAEPGLYSLAITTPDGCIDPYRINIVEDSNIPDLNINVAPLGCFSGGEITVTSLTPIVSYNWTGPDDFNSMIADPVVSVSGNYFLEVTVENGCVSNYSTFVPFVFSEIGVEILDGQITCDEPITEIEFIGDTLGLQFEWEGPDGFVDNSATPIVAASGWYNLTITDPITNCVVEDAVSVTDRTVPSLIEYSFERVSCRRPTKRLKFISVDSLLSFSWSGPDVVPQTDSTVIVGATGTYYIEYQNEFGCLHIDSVFIGADTIAPIITLGQNQYTLNCFDEKLTIDATSNFNQVTYLWRSDNGFSADIKDPLICDPGIYVVEIMLNRNGCIAKDSIEVEIDTVPAIPTFIVDNNALLECNLILGFATVESIDYNGTTMQSWGGEFPFTESTDGDTIFVNQGGTYFLDVQGDNGCENRYEFDIDPEEPELFYDLISENISCLSSNAYIAVESVEIDLAYNWEGPGSFVSDQSSFFTPTLGEYIVTITTNEGCTFLDTATVGLDTLNPILTPIYSDTLDCEELSISIGVESTQDIAEYLWSGDNFSSTDPFPIVMEGGTYLLTVTAENGCSATAILNVEQDNTIPFVNTSGGVIDCLQPTVELSATNTANFPTYTWEGPNLFTNESNPTVTDGGTYFVTIMDDNGCAKVDSAIVNLDTAPPDVQAFDNSLPCVGDSVQINGLSLDPGVEYRWIGPNGFNSLLQNPMVGEVGEYILIVIGDNGCTGVDTAIVDDVEVPPVFDVANGFLTCEDSTVEICGLFTDDDMSTEWLDDLGASLGTDNCVNIMEEGTYSLVVTGQNGCSAAQEFSVGIDTTKPVIVIENDFIFQCENIEVCLDASNSSNGSNFTNSWSSEDGNILNGDSSLILKVNQEGFYELEITDRSNGCSTVSGIVVAETTSTLSDLMFSVIEPSCFGFDNGMIEVTNVVGGQAPFEYSFMNGQFSSNNNFNFLSPGVYTIEVKDANGCTYFEEVSVGFGNDIQLELGDSDTISIGDSIDISAITNISLSQIQSTIWEPNIPGCELCTSFTFSPEETVTVQLTIIDQNGCSTTDNIRIVVEDEANVYVPNIFSPDGNGTNDFFVIYSSELVQQVEVFQVIDRWGNLLHEAKDFVPGDESAAWDGNFRGRPVNPDVFAYIAELRMLSGKVELIKGTITLIR